MKKSVENDNILHEELLFLYTDPISSAFGDSWKRYKFYNLHSIYLFPSWKFSLGTSCVCVCE